MLKRIKIWMTAMALLFAVLLPSVPVFAAELSEETVEVPEDGKKHTVVAFGGSIAMVYPDGKMNVIANNPSGRIDVMLDGEVIKGIGLLTIPAQNKTNMVLEAGSYLVSNVSEQQADALKKAVADSLNNDMPFSDLSVIEEQEGMQGVNAFVVGNWGKLQTADGAAAPAGALPVIQNKTPEAAYQEFAEEMEESIRKEQEAAREEQNRESAKSDVQEEENGKSSASDASGEQNREPSAPGASGEQNREPSAPDVPKDENTGKEDTGNDGSNGVTGVCKHNWELDESVKVLVLDNGARCVTPPFYRCTICKTLMWMNQNVHVHNEEEKCEYCGYGGDSCADGSHDYVEKQLEKPIVLSDRSCCYTGTVEECTKCSRTRLTKADKHIHGDDFCEYCGYNKAGEKKE